MSPSQEPQRRTLVLFNASAGQKGGVATNGVTEEDIRRVMRDYDIGDELILTESEEHACAVIRDAVERGDDLVVAAGGDGTVACVGRELLGTRTALGILPCGSVMNIARMLDIPRDLDEAAAVLRDGVIRAIDVGQVEGRVFFECGSVGLNAAIFREAQRLDDREWRSILSAFWTFLRYRGARMTLYLDDEVVATRALMVTAANGPYTGIGFTIAPSARVDDGLFDVRIFRGYSRLGLAWHLTRVAFGRRSWSPKVLTFRSRRVRVESRRPLPCRADSHDLGVTPVTFSVLPGALRIVVPASTDGHRDAEAADPRMSKPG